MSNHWKYSLCLLGLTAAACSTTDLLVDVVDQTIDTLATYGRQREVQSAFLATSTVVFYPGGIPSDVEALPALPSEHVALIQRELDTQANLLLTTVRDEKAFLSRVLQQEISSPSGQRFVVQQLNLPTAKIDDSGTIVIDLKVLQAIYRGSLVSVAGSEPWGECEPLLSVKCQRESMLRVFSARQAFLNRSPIPAASTAEGLLQMLKANPRTMADLGAALSDRMEKQMFEWSAQSLAIESSKRFDDAVMFVIAHELGHRVLSHTQRLQRGETQFALEAEADRFASVLTALARNSAVRPRYPTLKRMDGVMYEGTPNGWCSGDYNHEPKGFSDFFDFGYELSGFTDNSSDYPTKRERRVQARAITTAAMAAIDSAQQQLGRCGGAVPEGTIEGYLAKLHERWPEIVTEYQKLADEESTDSRKQWWMRWVIRYGDLATEAKVHEAFYREFRIRLQSPRQGSRRAS
ncbi:hypothetical protein [Roseateles microcysteis]|uniref:hypothetical protein n=1 Tax=Roseateles microcysteis TaxID=3119057 RepID=UPI002FE5AE95